PDGRDHEEAVRHRDVVVVQHLNDAADAGVGDGGGVRVARGVDEGSRTVAGDDTAGPRRGSVTTVQGARSVEDDAVFLDREAVAGVVGVELAHRLQRLDFGDVFDQSRVFVVRGQVDDDR